MENKTSRLLSSFEWHSILRNLLRNFWVIIMSAVIAVFGVYIVEHSIYTPEYKSSATLVVRAKASTSGAYTNLSASMEMASIFTEVFTQATVKKMAAENIGLDSFKGTISAAVNGETNLLVLTVTANSPELAYKLLDSILEVYPSVSEAVFSNAAIDVLVQPEMPEKPSSTITSSLRNKVTICAVLLQIFLIVLISFLRDTVKNPTGFEEKIDSKLIGTISHEKIHLSLSEFLAKKKRALLINDVYASLKFTEDYQKIATKFEYLNKSAGSRVFTITSVAENEGKSTVAANVSLALASRGYNVILVDLDAHKPSLYKIFNYRENLKTELNDILAGSASPRELKLLKYKKSSLRLALNKTPRKDSSEWLGLEMTERCINAMKKKADFVIIDTPPLSVSADASGVIKLSDKSVLIVRTDRVKVSDINDTISTISDISGNLAGCILNNVYKPFSFFGQMGSDERGYYNSKYQKYGSYKRYDNYKSAPFVEDMFNSDFLSDTSDF